MTQQILYTLAFTLGFLGLLFFTEFLYNRLKVPAEITRKTAHIAASLFSLIFLLTFQSYWYVVILGVIFFFVLFIGKRYNLFKSIYSIKRKSAGSYLLLASISLLFFISKEADNSLLFILPLLILAISDPLACIFGTWYQHKTRKIILFKREYDKTILGSSVFFISALVISITVLTFFSFTLTQIIIWSILLAALGTFIEIVSLNGTDNLTVPLVICLVLYFLSTT